MVVMNNTITIGSLEEQALKRKERLKNFKSKTSNNEESSRENNSKVALPKPKFRSYKPQDDKLQDAVMADAQPVAVEEEVKDLLEAANERVVLEDLDISSLAPRKPDWDLKRDVSKKLERLERRTQKAIAELIWERLKEGASDNLGAMVTMTDSRGTEEE